MEKYIYHRWYAENENGQHVFYIEVYDSKILDELFFNTSLPVDIFNDSEIKHLVSLLCKNEHTEIIRDAIAEKLIEKIYTLPGIKVSFFKDIMLDSNGKYCESYIQVLDEINRNSTIEIYTPYSMFSNEEIFHSLKNYFEYEVARNECIQVTKTRFEECIRNYSSLQNAYSEIYLNNLEYYYYSGSEDSVLMSCYCIVENTELLFVLFTELSEIIPT